MYSYTLDFIKDRQGQKIHFWYVPVSVLHIFLFFLNCSVVLRP